MTDEESSRVGKEPCNFEIFVIEQLTSLMQDVFLLQSSYEYNHRCTPKETTHKHTLSYSKNTKSSPDPSSPKSYPSTPHHPFLLRNISPTESTNSIHFNRTILNRKRTPELSTSSP